MGDSETSYCNYKAKQAVKYGGLKFELGEGGLNIFQKQ